MEATRWRWFLPTLLGTTALLKVFLAWRFPAFLTGDDLEIVETAARYAIGLDYQPWAIRSLFHPLLLAYPPVEAGALVGLADPRSITVLAALPAIVFSTLAIGLVHRLARAWGWSEPTARAAAFFYAFHWLPLGYGSTPYPRPISTCFLLAAFLVVERAGGRASRIWPAGLLAAAAFAVRWSEGVVLLPLLLWTWWRGRSVRNAAAVAVGFAAGVLLFVGLLDALTWGSPFASLVAFWRTMVVEGLAAAHPQPHLWYLRRIFHWAGPLLFLLLIPAAGDRRARAPLAIALAILVLMSLSPLKYLRYMQACLPFLVLASALGWERLRDGQGLRRGLAAAALVLTIPIGLERTLTLLEDKSASAVQAARFLHGLDPPVRTVVLEQMWAYGEKLYLGNAVSLRDLPTASPLALPSLEAALPGADAVAVYERDLAPEGARLLTQSGFRLCQRFQGNASPAAVVYLPNGRLCAGP